MGNVQDAAFTGSSAFYLTDHLTEIKLGHDQRLHTGSQFANLVFGERPTGDQAEFSNLQASCPGQFNGTLGDARGDSVRDYDNVGIVESLGFKQRNAIDRGS